MNRTSGIAVAVCVLASAATPARAQTVPERASDYLRQPVRAPSHAFELGVDTGYTQGFGSLSAARPIGNVAGGGAEVGLSLGYRATPVVYVGWRGALQDYARRAEVAQGASVRGFTTSAAVDLHLAPYMRLDPWVGIGTGYRRVIVMPEGPGSSGYASGLEPLKLQAGLNVRPTTSIALGPVIGVDVDYFAWSRPMGLDTTASIADRRVSTYIYAGIAAQFDLTGDRKAAPIFQAARQP